MNTFPRTTFRRHYEVSYPCQWSKSTRHQWTVNDYESKCAVHLWIAEHPESVISRTSGGVEYHYSVAVEGCTCNEPCQWTGGKCWHTGSSTEADRFRRDFEDCQAQRCEFDPPWNYLEARLAEAVAEVAALKGGGK